MSNSRWLRCGVGIPPRDTRYYGFVWQCSMMSKTCLLGNGAVQKVGGYEAGYRRLNPWPTLRLSLNTQFWPGHRITSATPTVPFEPMQPSDSFRARRPPSPHKLALTHPPPPPQPRFPQHRASEYVGADEKLDAVRQDVAGRPVLTRKLHTGGLRKMTPGEWKLLIVIALIACAVRLFRLSKPNSVVYVTRTRRRGNGGLRYYHLVSTRYTLESLLENISRYELAVQVPTASAAASMEISAQAMALTAPRGFQTRYYVDVHPPLAKLLLTLAAFVGGFDGNFDFKDIGK